MAVTADERAARELLKSVVGGRDAEIYEAFGLLAVEDSTPSAQWSPTTHGRVSC
jgi:hypothetical protein